MKIITSFLDGRTAGRATPAHSKEKLKRRKMHPLCRRHAIFILLSALVTPRGKM